MGRLARAGICFRASFGLFARNALLESFVVHVEIAHGLFFGSGGQAFELLLERLIVDLELVFDLLLFSAEFLNAISRQMLPLNLGSVQT